MVYGVWCMVYGVVYVYGVCCIVQYTDFQFGRVRIILVLSQSWCVLSSCVMFMHVHTCT